MTAAATYGGRMPPDLIDWEVAASTARTLTPAGPSVPFAEAASVVDQLREFAVDAESHVRKFTGLADDQVPPAASVVDRPGWIDNNIEGFRFAVGPLLASLAERRADHAGALAPGVIAAVGSRVTGAQVGAILAFLATRVLGQYEIFLPEGQGEGRLSLVAPNIVATERRLGVDPRDFRLWVCLHESTHRTQFTAHPWMRDHLLAEMTELVNRTDLDASALAARLREALGAVVQAIRGGTEGASLIEALQTPAQREILDRVTALMSLLEGHAEFVMDGVGPEVVPSVTTLRKRFDTRRHGNPVERVVRRLIGLDLKMAQYADGHRFVQAVVDRVGMPAFNHIWTDAETLPTRAELHDPAAWVARVSP